MMRVLRYSRILMTLSMILKEEEKPNKDFLKIMRVLRKRKNLTRIC